MIQTTGKMKRMKVRTWELRAAAVDPKYRREMIERYHDLHGQTLTPGSVVEFLKLGQPAIGILMMAGGRMHHILDAEGKEHAVPRDKVIDISTAFIGASQTRHEIVTELRDLQLEREELKAGIDLRTLWELAAAEYRAWSLAELTELYYAGHPGPHGRAALYRALAESGLFRRDGQCFIPVSREEAAQWLEQERQAEVTEAWLREAGVWLRRIADGEAAPPPPNADRALEMLAGRVVFGARYPEARDAARLASAGKFHTRESIIDALAAAGYWERDVNLDLLRYETPTAFSEQAISEARSARWRKRMREAPALTGRKIFAFAEREPACEQAFSLRADHYGFTAGIHLASPALLIRFDGAVRHEAEERALALDLPDRSIPMLPPALTERVLLNTGQYRPCLTLFVRFSPDGTLERYHFTIRRVRITDILPADAAIDRHESSLQRLSNLAAQLRRRRLEAGAVVINEPEVEAQVEDEEVIVRRHDPNALGRLIERELSILANTLTGELCVKEDIAAIYRMEDPPSEIIVDPDRFDPVANHLQKRLMRKAVLQSTPAPHAGIGATAYVPITASCRRYMDLLMHRQLLGVLDEDGRVLFPAEELREALLKTATARMTGREIETNAKRFWLLRYLERQAGRIVPAVVLERYTAGYLVELAETGLRAYCPADSSVAFTSGAMLRVRLERVSARADVLHVRIGA